MKVDYVAVSSTCDSFYLDFWPIVSRIWKKKFNYTPVLFLVHTDKSIRPTEEFGEVVYFEPLPDVPLNIQAQCSRYWLPSTKPDAIWMTSDIDMFPISRSYFIDSLANIPNDKFVNMNARGVGIFPCCYNVAMGKTYKEVIGLPDSYEEYLKQTKWQDFKKDHTPQNSGISMSHWGIDEWYPNQQMKRYNETHASKHKFVMTTRNGSPPRDTCPLRVDRQSSNRWNRDHVVNERYIDAHSLRPYTQHKHDIDTLVALIMKEHQ